MLFRSLAVGNSYFGKYLGTGVTGEPTRPPTEYNLDLNRTLRAKRFVPRKKIHGQKVATRIILIYNEVRKGDVMRTKTCCGDVQLGSRLSNVCVTDLS